MPTLLFYNATVNERTLAFTLRSPFNLVLQLADSSVWLDVVAEVRKAIREHEGYIYIPDLAPKGEKGVASIEVTPR